MEKIFYNKKIKKVLIILIVIIILSSYILPLTSYATSKTTSLTEYIETVGEKKYGISKRDSGSFEYREEAMEEAWGKIKTDTTLYEPLIAELKKNDIFKNVEEDNIYSIISKKAGGKTDYTGWDWIQGNYYFAECIQVVYDEENFKISEVNFERSNWEAACLLTLIFETDFIGLEQKIPRLQYISGLDDDEVFILGRQLIETIRKKSKRNEIEFYIQGNKIIVHMKLTSESDFFGAIMETLDINELEIGDIEEGAALKFADKGLEIEIITADSEEGTDDLAVWLNMQYNKISESDYNEYILKPLEGHYTVETDDETGNIIGVTATIGFDDFNDKINDYIWYHVTGSEEVQDEVRAKICELFNIEEPEDDWSIGGILLSPIIYLVNFITDSVTRLLGEIMMGGVTSGFKVLVNNPPSSTYTKTDQYEIDMKSFVLGSNKYPNIKYTPEEIFSGEVPILSIDFISGKSTDSGWNTIRNVISSWYKALRMIAIIGLLSVLIYTGIKIIISANAKDKAKYKEWIINWFVAVAILFSMHYIMSFIISVTGEINKLLGESCQGIEVVLKEDGLPTGTTFTTNLMGLVRFIIQSENLYYKVGYEIMYIALITYTVKFTILYLKRVLNMAFLTLIAPIVALTYPIDKINDGTAQGFNMWLKEYIFNALLQPMHYIMYYILVGSAVSITAKNPIYGIVVLMFMTEAEKLLKKIFGFDKANGGTVGGMAGAFAAGALASNIKNMAKMGKLPGGNGGKDGAGGDKNNPLNNPKPIADKSNDDEMFNDSSGGALPGGESGTGPETSDDDEEKTDAQKMFEADEENGEFDDDPERREALAQDADGATPGGMYDGMSDDEFRESLREMGLDDEAIEQAMEGRNGGQQGNQSDGEAETPPTPEPSTEPIRKLAAAKNWAKQKAKRLGKGSKAVGKRLLKPVWDMDRNAGYNFKRLAKGAGRAALGVGVGITAAAVQAGISITDGKYSPMEGIATFTAGYAGGGKIAKGMGSLVDTYREGRDEGDKEAIMERAKARWSEREDVINYNKKYDKSDRKQILEIQKQLLEQGISDPKEMDRCIKYMKKSNGGSIDSISPDLVKKSRALSDFEGELDKYGMKSAIRDADKQRSYIETATKGLTGNAKTIKTQQLQNKFDEMRKFQDANKK